MINSFIVIMCLVIILRGNGYMTNNQLTKIEIDNYKAFNGFVMRLCPQEGLNLNLLIGRNGSGKSSFLDALAEIACNNLTSAPDKSVDNTSFQYGLIHMSFLNNFVMLLSKTK